MTVGTLMVDLTVLLFNLVTLLLFLAVVFQNSVKTLTNTTQLCQNLYILLLL